MLTEVLRTYNDDIANLGTHSLESLCLVMER